jgi:hypothetical protein
MEMTSGYFTLFETYHVPTECGLMNFRVVRIHRADVTASPIAFCKWIKPKLPMLSITTPGEGWRAESANREWTSPEGNSATNRRASY